MLLFKAEFQKLKVGQEVAFASALPNFFQGASLKAKRFNICNMFNSFSKCLNLSKIYQFIFSTLGDTVRENLT